jgi:protein arginine kinase
MLFLPALSMTGRMETIAEQLSNANLTVRGVYGESGKMGEIQRRGAAVDDGENGGYMFQISNQACFGMTERQILEMVKSVTVQIAELEIKAEAAIFRQQGDGIIDSVLRAWGLLTNAFMLSSAEAVENLALLKLGSNLGILKFKNQRVLDDLFFTTQPETLKTVDTRAAATAARDKIRAKRVAEVLRQSRV